MSKAASDHHLSVDSRSQVCLSLSLSLFSSRNRAPDVGLIANCSDKERLKYALLRSSPVDDKLHSATDYGVNRVDVNLLRTNANCRQIPAARRPIWNKCRETAQFMTERSIYPSKLNCRRSG